MANGLSAQYKWLRILSNVFAIGVTQINGHFRGRIMILYTIIYNVFLFVCLVLMITERKWLYRGFSTLMTLCIYGQAGLMWMFNLAAMLSIFFWQSRFYSFYEEIQTISFNLEKELQQPQNLYRPVNVYIIMVLISFPVIAILDIVLEDQFVSFPFWICTHVPGITSAIYVNYIISLLNACTNSFESINKHFEGFTFPHMSTMEKISMSLAPAEPKMLRECSKLREKFQRVFVTYNLVCVLAKEINRVSGISLFFLILFGGCTFLGLVYNAAMYFVMKLQGRESEWCTLYTQDYWRAIYFAELAALTRSSVSLMRSSNRIGIILHKIRNLFPHIGEEWVNIYSLQILHEKISISAASVYILDSTFLSGAVAIITILIVTAVQYDEGYLATNPRTALTLAKKFSNATAVV